MKDLAFRIFVSLIYVRENVYFWDFSNKIGPDPTHTDSKSLKKYVFNLPLKTQRKNIARIENAVQCHS